MSLWYLLCSVFAISVYDAIKNPDGTLALSDAQKSSLAERNFTPDQIYSALLKLYNLSRADRGDEVPVEHLPPCPSCGNLDFIPTGNCHVCKICGASQGCS